MKLILDAFPWDLTLTIGGVDYPTVPMRFGDILADLHSPDLPDEKPGQAEAVERAVAPLRKLFAPGHCPDLASLDWTVIVGIRDGYKEYAQSRLKKNAQARASALAGQMGTPEATAGLPSLPPIGKKS